MKFFGSCWAFGSILAVSTAVIFGLQLIRVEKTISGVVGGGLCIALIQIDHEIVKIIKHHDRRKT